MHLRHIERSHFQLHLDVAQGVEHHIIAVAHLGRENSGIVLDGVVVVLAVQHLDHLELISETGVSSGTVGDDRYPEEVDLTARGNDHGAIRGDLRSRHGRHQLGCGTRIADVEIEAAITDGFAGQTATVPTVNGDAKVVFAFRQLLVIEWITVVYIGLGTMHHLGLQHIGPHHVGPLVQMDGHQRKRTGPRAHIEGAAGKGEIHVEIDVQACTSGTGQDELHIEVTKRIVQIAGHGHRQGRDPLAHQHLNGLCRYRLQTRNKGDRQNEDSNNVFHIKLVFLLFR